MIKLTKSIKEKEGKRYTNYMINLVINGLTYKVAIEPKTFGRDYKHPSVRQAYTLLDIIAVKEED